MSQTANSRHSNKMEVNKLPVAIKRTESAVGEAQQSDSWSKIVVEDSKSQESDDIHIDLEGMTVLHDTKKLKWTTVLYWILSLGDHTWWRIFVSMSIVINYVQVTYASFFLRDFTHKNTSYAIALCDIIYAVDYIFAISAYLSKNLQLRSVNPPRSRTTIIFDGILGMPCLLAYKLIYRQTHTVPFLLLHLIPFLRLYHLECLFKEKDASAGICHWKYFTAQYFVYFFLLQHSMACCWYLLACPLDCVEHIGWSYALYDLDRPYPETPFEWYVACMYFALINITTVGFGDVIATDTLERIIACLTMALGFTLTTGVFIGALSSQFVNSTMRKALMQHQMVAIKKYFVTSKFHKDKVKKVMSYYDILWTKKKGVHDAEDISLLPKPLRMEICFDVNYCLLNCSLIFRDKPESYLRAVSLKMKHKFYQAGEIIFHQHVIKQKMVCIASGVIEILSDEDNQSPIISFTAGTCIGEAALILTTPARATIRAACYTEVQVLYRKDFFKMIDCYPQHFDIIRNQILERISDAMFVTVKSDSREVISLSLFVPQNRKLSEIRKLKDRLNPKTAYTFDSGDTFYRKCLPLYRFSENLRKTTGNHLCLSETFPWILQPETSLTWTWEVLIFINTFLIGILYPYYIAFERRFPPWLEAVSVVMELINVFDICVILTTAIIKKDRVLVTFKDILQDRLDTIGFYLDVISALYIDIFAYVLPNSAHIYYVLKLNRMVKMYRIPKFFTHLEKRVTVKLSATRFVKYPIYLIMCPYWFGVILYIKTCFNDVCDQTGWYFNKLSDDIAHQLSEPCTKHKVHISVYYALSSLSGVGYGDILPGNQRELIIICCGVLIGIFVFGYCTAELSAVLSHNLKQKIDFQETLFSIKSFLKDNSMRKDIQKRIMDFFVLQWYFNEGIGVTTQMTLFYNATVKIQQEVSVKRRADIIIQIPLFHNSNVDFLQLLSSGARVKVLPPGEVVIYEGGMAREMYVIHKGYCEKVEGNRQMMIIGPSESFGVECLLYGIESMFTVRTLTHVKIIVIEVDIFTNATSIFPDIATEMKIAADEIKFQEKLPHAIKESRVKRNYTHTKERKASRKYFQGSFLNVYSYCKTHGEDYGKPFKGLGHLSFLKYFILPISILPDGLFIKVWVSFRTLVACYVCIFTPYQLIQAPYAPLQDKILSSLQCISFLDLYIMMLVGYYGELNQLVIHPYKTAQHYMKALFIFDVLFCFPYEVLIKFLVPDHNEGHSAYSHTISPHLLHCIFTSIRVLQVYRLPLCFKYFEGDITQKGDILQIVKFVPYTILFVNAWACTVIVTSCKYYNINDIPEEHIKNNTVYMPGLIPQKLTAYNLLCKEDSWIDRSDYYRFSAPPKVYIAAVYWCIATLGGAGYGDITPQDKTHLMVAMGMVIFGVLVFCYIFANISSHKAATNSTLSLHQEMLVQLKNFLVYENVNLVLQKRITDYYEYIWQRTGGIEPNVILRNVHTVLLEDALLYMYEKTLREVPLFDHVEHSFFRIMGKHLCERYFLKGQTIIRANELQENLFIIYRGKVEVLSSTNEMQTCMGVGGLYGNLTFQFACKSSVTITAIKNLDTLFLPAIQFFSILKHYPIVLKRMQVYLQEGTNYIMPTVVSSSDGTSQTTQLDDFTIVEETSFSKTPIDKTSASTAGTTNTFNKGLDTLELLTMIFRPRKWCRVAINPDAAIFTVYGYILVLSAYINTLLASYQFAFQHHTAQLLLVAILLDIIFVLKMFVDIHKVQVDRYGEYIVDNHQIRQLYFKNKKQRAFDFLANTPVYYFAFLLPMFFTVNVFLVFSCIRMITVLRSYYIIEYYRSRCNVLSAKMLQLKLSVIIMWITLMTHFFGCVWYLLACPVTFCIRQSWLFDYLQGNDMELTTTNKFSIYVLCFYHVMNTLTTTGSGDIPPKTYVELTFISMMLLVTKFCVGIFIADVTCVLNAYTSSLVNYEYGIQELRDYLQNENVSNHQMEKMWYYVQQLWTRSRGKQIPRLIAYLPYTMRCDIMYAVYGQDLRQSYIFSGTEEAFIRQLTIKVDHVICFPGNYIVQHGDSDQSMYFIHRGEVDILTVHPNLTETIHDVLHTGEMFGLVQGLFHGVPHRFSFRARTTVDIISLELNKWKDLGKFFPTSTNIIYEKAQEIYRAL